MTKIVFATGNRGKLREASEILGEGFELYTPADFGITEDIPETGDTLEENSRQKAEIIQSLKGCDCFADDTGLEVDALGGAPGVYTARYAGESKDFNLNMDKDLHQHTQLHATGDAVTPTAPYHTHKTQNHRLYDHQQRSLWFHADEDKQQKQAKADEGGNSTG